MIRVEVTEHISWVQVNTLDCLGLCSVFGLQMVQIYKTPSFGGVFREKGQLDFLVASVRISCLKGLVTLLDRPLYSISPV